MPTAPLNNIQSQKLIETIRRIIATELELPVESLDDSASLREAYGLDSVAAVNVIFALENTFGVAIDIRKIAAIRSINDLKSALSEDESIARFLANSP